MQTHFTSQTIPELFRDLFLGERTGILALNRDCCEKRVFFFNGLIHYAESTEPEEDLGHLLVSEKKLSGGALEEARRAINDPRELPRALVNRELVSKHALGETVRSLVRTVIESVFTWEGGSARFTDTPPPEDAFDTDVLRTFEDILAGVFVLPEFDAFREPLVALDNRVRVRKPGPIPLERLTLSPTHGFILSRLDGTTGFADLVNLLPEDEESGALRFLFGLLVMGVLELDPPLGEGPFRLANILRDHADSQAMERMQAQNIRQAEERMRGQAPHDVLAVRPDATLPEIEQAYEDAKDLFGRDRVLPKVRDKFKGELAVIESRLIEAYLTLTRPEQHAPSPSVADTVEGADGEPGARDYLVRVEMDKTKSKLEQEEAARVGDSYFTKANKAVREGDFHNAIQYVKLAISYNEEDARYYYLLADCQVRNPGPRWQHQAEQNFSKATELDPWNADYWVGLGRFYKRRGLKLRAQKHFEEALKVVPNHEIASAELASIE
ncbi:MAG: DUF4388 domain-containing protein [bacterium]|nr:DUF4388 domain-containing protein [bacterium]